MPQPEAPQKGPDFPDDKQLQAWGDILFLAMRSERHRDWAAWQLREAFEPAVTTGQYKIFRFDGVPRGLITYGLLSYDAEQRYVAGGVLAPDDWRSGRQLWVTEIMAPYKGLTHAISRWLMKPGNLTEREFYFRRLTKSGETRKVLHVDFQGDRLGSVLNLAEFGLKK